MYTFCDKIVTDTKSSFESLELIYSDPVNFAIPIVKKINSYIAAYQVIKLSITDKTSKYNFEAQSALYYLSS